METAMLSRAGNPHQANAWRVLSLRGFFDRMVSQRRQRRAIHILGAMSDHQLRDIGIGRSEIDHTVRCGHPRRDY